MVDKNNNLNTILNALPVALSWHRADGSLYFGNACFQQQGHASAIKKLVLGEGQQGWLNISQPALGLAGQLVHGLLEAVPEAVFLRDRDGHYLLANRAWSGLLGVAGEQLKGASDETLQVAPQLQTTLSELQSLVTIEQQPHQRQCWLPHADGRCVLLQLSLSPLFDSDNTLIGMIGVGLDITEHHEKQQRLEQLARYDETTGLLARASFLLQLAHYCQHLPVDNGQLVVLDIDHFRQINAQYGEQTGDAVLVAVAQQLKALLPDAATLARLGPDNFGIICPDHRLSPQHYRSLCGAFQIPCGGRIHRVTLTGGITPLKRAAPERLLREVEQAQSFAQQHAPGTLQRFEPVLAQQLSVKQLLLDELAEAVHNQQLTLNFQPQMSACGRYLIGAEALVRWYSPKLGHVSPEQFIPLAEQNGLICDIGRQVLTMALAELAYWQQQGSPLVMAINLSPAQLLDDELVELVHVLAAQYEVDLCAVELEFTEHMLLDSSPQVIDRLQQLAELGIRFAIDDFGTGYCSLSYLKQFVVHKLKIDRSFVADLCDEPHTRAITAAIAGLATELGMTITAEGVESVAQLRLLQKMGVNEIQGYLFSRPLAQTPFREWCQSFMREARMPTAIYSSSSLASGSS